MNYREEVLRNCPKFGVDPIEKKLSLGGLGVAGEAAELLELIASLHRTRDKIVLEAGDVYWYLEFLAATLDTTREDCIDFSQSEKVGVGVGLTGAILISIQAGGIADTIKKVLHHEVPLDKKRDAILTKMGVMYRLLEEMGYDIGYTPDQVMGANIAKLRARHPNGWTPQSQQAKADERAA